MSKIIKVDENYSKEVNLLADFWRDSRESQGT